MYPQLEMLGFKPRCAKNHGLSTKQYFFYQSIFTQPVFKSITSNNCITFIPSSGKKNKFALLPFNVYYIGNIEGTNYYFACFCIIDCLFRSSVPSKFPGTPSRTCLIIPGFMAIIRDSQSELSFLMLNVLFHKKGLHSPSQE